LASWKCANPITSRRKECYQFLLSGRIEGYLQIKPIYKQSSPSFLCLRCSGTKVEYMLRSKARTP
jgi:hypothetical protein